MNLSLRFRFAMLLFPVLLLSAAGARAAGGLLGIDHRLTYDDSGIWNRTRQKQIFVVMVLTTVGVALDWYAHSRKVPLLIEILPHGIAVGPHTHF